MKDVVLIDLDGTLTDSRPGIFNSIIYSLKKMGEPVPEEEVLLKFIGPPLVDSFMNYMGFSKEKAEEGLAGYREYFAVKGLFENSVYDGVYDCLKTLKAAGKTLVMATSKPEDFAKRIADRFELTQYFDMVCGASMDESRNTKPAVINYALESMGITDRSRVVMVGDRRHDIEGAKETGIASIGVLYGYGDLEELEKAGADHIAKTPSDIAEFLSD